MDKRPNLDRPTKTPEELEAAMDLVRADIAELERWLAEEKGRLRQLTGDYHLAIIP